MVDCWLVNELPLIKVIQFLKLTYQQPYKGKRTMRSFSTELKNQNTRDFRFSFSKKNNQKEVFLCLYFPVDIKKYRHENTSILSHLIILSRVAALPSHDIKISQNATSAETVQFSLYFNPASGTSKLKKNFGFFFATLTGIVILPRKG